MHEHITVHIACKLNLHASFSTKSLKFVPESVMHQFRLHSMIAHCAHFGRVHGAENLMYTCTSPLKSVKKYGQNVYLKAMCTAVVVAGLS